MSSSTLNSNYKKRLCILIANIMLFYMIANWIAYYTYQWVRAKQESRLDYFGDARGKNGLMNYFYQNESPDVVFIGNSLTMQHIDTNFFLRSGLKVFNYATVGYFIAQYPSMVANAIKLKPKFIAISIRKNDFYEKNNFYYDHYNHDDDFTAQNIYFLINHTKNINEAWLLSKFITSYLKNINFFLAKGHALTHNLAELYKQVGHKPNPVKAIVHLMRPIPSQLMLTCDFDSEGNRMPVDCYNGDHVTVKALKEDAIKREKVLLVDKDYNYFLVSVLNGLFDRIKEAGIQPLLVLVPSYQHYVANDDLFNQTLHASVIDLSNLPLPTNHFTDTAHYNLKGRHVYSLALSSKIKRLLSS
ncbi:MAG: hypothetical protein H0W64_09440 [Gammaproteobacteria bacterium]|nr:hypothetical protein [Gammaproteobacteria bacterium]